MDLREASGSVTRRHPWESSRAWFFSDIVRELFWSQRPVQVLDVGAGDGYVAEQLVPLLAPESQIVCWDIGYASEAIEAHPSGRIRCVRTPPSERFDLLMLLDVLEHIEDDIGFLHSVVEERLAPGGWVLMSMPAWPALFGRHDVQLGHFRRYTRASCRALCKGAGLEVERSGGAFLALVLPRLALNLFEPRGSGAAVPGAHVASWSFGPRVTWLLETALRAELSLARRIGELGLDVPGLSYWALCRRPP